MLIRVVSSFRVYNYFLFFKKNLVLLLTILQ